MVEKRVYILVGVPCSGKSTWIKDNINEKDFFIASSDRILESISDTENISYEEAFKKYYDFANKLFWQSLENAIKYDFSIVIDRTNLSKKTRKRLLNLIPKNYKKICVFFDVPEDIINQRLEKRNAEGHKIISQNVIKNMKKYFTKPDLNEGFDEILEIG